MFFLGFFPLNISINSPILFPCHPIIRPMYPSSLSLYIIIFIHTFESFMYSLVVLYQTCHFYTLSFTTLLTPSYLGYSTILPFHLSFCSLKLFSSWEKKKNRSPISFLTSFFALSISPFLHLTTMFTLASSTFLLFPLGLPLFCFSTCFLPGMKDVLFLSTLFLYHAPSLPSLYVFLSFTLSSLFGYSPTISSLFFSLFIAILSHLMINLRLSISGSLFHIM